MGLDRNGSTKTDDPDGFDVEQLSNELIEIGEEKFREKYSHTFLVAPSQIDLDADTYAHRTMAVDKNITLENPLDQSESDDSSSSRVCYPVKKSERNTFTSRITVGRSRKNDVILRSQSISKVHAALIPGDPWKIVDVGSSNGTKLNKKRLIKNIEIELGSGDVISFAGFSLRFMTWSDFHSLLKELAEG